MTEKLSKARRLPLHPPRLSEHKLFICSAELLGRTVTSNISNHFPCIRRIMRLRRGASLIQSSPRVADVAFHYTSLCFLLRSVIFGLSPASRRTSICRELYPFVTFSRIIIIRNF